MVNPRDIAGERRRRTSSFVGFFFVLFFLITQFSHGEGFCIYNCFPLFISPFSVTMLFLHGLCLLGRFVMLWCIKHDMNCWIFNVGIWSSACICTQKCSGSCTCVRMLTWEIEKIVTFYPPGIQSRNLQINCGLVSGSTAWILNTE